MNILLITLSVLFVIEILFAYSACVETDRISRMEEKAGFKKILEGKTEYVNL